MGKIKSFTLLTLGLATFSVLRWYYLIDEYSVNLLYWDQWGFYSVLFDQGSLWDIFTYQHGPHRQGIGFVLASFIADWSGWNTRVEAFTIGSLVLFATALFLFLKRRLIGPLNPFDIVIVLIGLSPIQYGLYTHTPNISHGSMPFLLLALYCLSWTIKGNHKYVILCLVNFLMIFTGFGLFIGLITPLLLIFELLKSKGGTIKKLIITASLGLAILSLLYFFYDYKSSPAKPDFELSLESFWHLLLFLLTSVANYWSFEHLSFVKLLFAGVNLLILLFVLIKATKKLWKNPNDSVSRMVIILIGFSLLFLLAMTIGRFSYGIGGAKASRYMIYLSPAFIGLHLYLSKVSIHPLTKLLYLLLLLYPSFHTSHLEENMDRISTNKRNWVKVYFENEDWEEANKLSGFKIHPKPRKVHLRKRLVFLKENNLNLYKE